MYKGEKLRKYAIPLVKITIPKTATNNLFSSVSLPIKIKNRKPIRNANAILITIHSIAEIAIDEFAPI